jgi:hypothetical protein
MFDANFEALVAGIGRKVLKFKMTNSQCLCVHP